MKKPIIEFKTQEELDICLKEWQDKLFLNDWIIKAVIVDKCEEIDGNTCAATNTHVHDNKHSFIEIAKHKKDAKYIAKQSQEQ